MVQGCDVLVQRRLLQRRTHNSDRVEPKATAFALHLVTHLADGLEIPLVDRQTNEAVIGTLVFQEVRHQILKIRFDFNLLTFQLIDSVPNRSLISSLTASEAGLVTAIITSSSAALFTGLDTCASHPASMLRTTDSSRAEA